MKLKNLGYAAFIAATAVAFVIGSAGSSEAAKKKKEAAAPAPMGTCLLAAGKAVCGSKGGMTFTYANSCYAANDGAKVSSQGACKAAKAKKAKAKPAMKKSAAAKPAMAKPAAAKPAAAKPAAAKPAMAKKPAAAKEMKKN